ncbi:MmgE/PrpD family protein [Glaciibacter superstes]|uniref:MmgE/PrpD family protein n=1 Tax=Glaciibacter superstes TaxID=501023 RepID=UPI0003B432DB|nr:MmgE/PrpD family protein [Glaciibacter superstes]
MSTRTMAERLAEHVVAAHIVDDELSDQIRLFMLDYLAVTVGGIDRLSAVAARTAVDTEPSQTTARPSAIAGTGRWASIEDAALVNGITSHGLELDDTHEAGSMHPGVAIFPAAFAYADSHETDMETFVRAIAVGYDVMCSIGVLVGAKESYHRGFHPTAICGVIGAAAAISVMMGLDRTAASHALGLAANMAAGSLEFLANGSWTKRLNAGHAASTGIRAARLAQAGFTAPANYLEGRDGFLRQYGEGDSSQRDLVLSFGSGVRETSIKFYPCCRYMHGNIDLLRAIHDEHPELSLDSVTLIEAAVISAGAALISDPPVKKLNVQSTVDAQFNMPFGAALALSTGKATVDQFDDAVQVASQLADVMAKVRCYTSPRVEAAFPGSWQAEVKVHLGDGTIFERYAKSFAGSPNDNATHEDILDKAGDLVTPLWAATVFAASEALTSRDIIDSTRVLVG